MKTTTSLLACAVLAVSAPAVLADADKTAELTINGEIAITVRAEAPPHAERLGELQSGWLFRKAETRDMQMDDFDNPGMMGAEVGREMWAAVEGTEGKSCASCHGEPEDMAGVKAVYPKWNEAAGEVRTLQMQVNDCRVNRMGAEPLKTDAKPALNMEALLASVSRGHIVNVATDGPAQSVWEQGEELYYTRFGQLELACANCHEDNYGRMIRADHLSQGHITGFPTYRLKNAGLVGVQSRFRGCVRDTIAETFAAGSPEFVALELYVASRGNGLSIEGPSVRN